MATTNRLKFETKNPVVQKLIGRFHRQISELIAAVQPANILELGCGEGFLLAALRQRLPDIPMLGLDNNSDALADGRRLFPQLRLEPGDIYRIDQPDKSWDTVVASEVLEHLENPLQALQELKRVASRYVALSVPWEPWFRLGSLARGKHLRRFGNHPEHLNHWRPDSFRAWTNQVVRVEQLSSLTSFPWIIVRAKV